MSSLNFTNRRQHASNSISGRISVQLNTSFTYIIIVFNLLCCYQLLVNKDYQSDFLYNCNFVIESYSSVCNNVTKRPVGLLQAATSTDCMPVLYYVYGE